VVEGFVGLGVIDLDGRKQARLIIIVVDRGLVEILRAAVGTTSALLSGLLLDESLEEGLGETVLL